MQFSSRPPYNDDPMPWVKASGERSYTRWRGAFGAEYPIDPRPEFDRPQNNPTNRLLTAARYAHAEGYLLDFCEGFLSERNTEHLEIDHAQRVLTKWRYLSKVES